MRNLETLVIEGHDQWRSDLSEFVVAGLLQTFRHLPNLTRLRVTDEQIAGRLVARLMIYDVPCAPLQDMASRLTKLKLHKPYTCGRLLHFR